ncbi:response regulator [Achromobacter xylosoxidans]|uniref:Response regulator n=2 Tax=Alcaligenaceae TaxID=506 RepID=A0A424WHQ7_ALCXX|nr:response regulator [Achromobacter xylosoxidans]MBC9902784.1 response regulator [Achromobacter xylosoxidans]MBD0868614.1 response regulator [Achromobacter xylosoxidans]QNP89092.1 response regulator [Achromobacter xylosoxidans]RPJ92781.1 response regulator [Achromobacter xylosoxidans]
MKPLNLRVMVADDHPAVRAGVQHTLATSSTVSVIGAARDSSELMEMLGRHPCEVLISDYSMPGGRFGDGITLFGLIRQRYPALKIVVLTMLESPGIVHSLLNLGIPAVLSKSDSLNHLLPAIHGAHANGRYLSPRISELANALDRGDYGIHMLTRRELEVVRLFVSGLTINEIAERLHRSKKTISTQKGTAMLKLGLERDIELLRYGIESGLISASPSSGPAGATQEAASA